MSGWIKVDRRIMQNPLWNDTEPFDKRSAWLDLLLMANHSDHEVFHRGKFVMVKRGEVNRSILHLSERWHWSRNKTIRFLETLRVAEMISMESTTDGTTIFIKNYNKYQFLGTTNDTTNDTTKTVKKYSGAEVIQTTNDTTNETTRDTTHDTTGDTTDGTHTINIKEHIKNNKERERKIISNADSVGLSVKDYIKARAKADEAGVSVAEYLKRGER